MRRYRKWVMTLGIVATAPGVVMAGPFSFLNRDKPKSAATRTRSAQDQASPNQRLANEVAKSLQAAKLQGSGISVRVQGGVATLTGHLTESNQKEMATRLTQRVPGIERVENRMVVTQTKSRAGNPLTRLFGGAKEEQPSPPKNAIRLAGGTVTESRKVRQVSDEVPADVQQAASAGGGANLNQQTAQQIATALSEARLNGFDIHIHYQNGIARLMGSVGDPAQRTLAESVTRNVSGVEQVENQLQVAARPTPRMYGSPTGAENAQPRMAHQGYTQQQMPNVPLHQVNYQPAAPPAGPAPYPTAPAYGPVPPQAYGHPGGGTPQTVYNNAQLPQHAWPSYAQYPNSAQVSYPKQYSASAWPYIGPFYPYPQVPMGWRNVQLQWDDGQWMLDFNPKTEKWWWFVNPHNW